MDVIVVSILVIITLTIVLRICQNSKRTNNFLDTLPIPPGLPIVGHILEINSTTKILNKTEEYLRNYGNRYKVKAAFYTIFVTTDKKFLEFLLNKKQILKKSLNYNYLYPWLGTGLLTGDGVKWKKHRKIITPAFHFTILKRFVPTFESAGDILVEKLQNLVNTECVDIYPIISLCTLDVICETAMGAKINAQNDTTSDYVNAVKGMCKLIIDRCLNPIELFEFTFKYTKNYQKQTKFIEILHNYSTKIIKQKSKILMNTGLTKQIDVDGGVDEKAAFLDVLLKLSNAEDHLTQDELREEVDTFMFEGHDTSAVSISFTLYCLANHPEFQEKAYNEQLQLFNNKKNPDITYENLNEMKYLELIIKESLRLYPSVPFIGRYTTEDIEFENKIIPKHTNITVPIYFVHRNPEIFENPDTFNPERFNNYDNSTPYAYIPFSAGSRNCIGQKFAMLEMKSVISKIIRNFELLPAKPQHNLQLSVEIVLKSANGIRIGVKQRN